MEMFPFLKQNVEALEKMGHAAYLWLSSRTIDTEKMKTSLIVNRHGILDWRIPGGESLFDQAPPQAFYSKWDGGPKPATSATILVGCNIGYGLNHLLLKTPDSHKIVVLEPDPEMLLACLSQTDYRPFMESRKLHFAVPDEGYMREVVKNLDLQYLNGLINLRVDVASQQMSPAYAEWGRRMRDRIENFCVEMNTLRCRQDVMVGNELKNFRRVQCDGSISALQGAAGGVAAVILGAGPSLAEFGPSLAENPGYALYASALQTLPALRAVGITPHFCLAIDYDRTMLGVYKRLDPAYAASIPLIYSTKVQPEVVERYPGPTLPLWTLGGMATFVLQESELILDAGGNVSIALSRLLRWLGASHILLVGQDFAWTGTRSHAPGHHSSAALRKFNPAQHMKLKNLNGEEIISTVQYQASKRELEDDIAQSGFPIFNLYGGGSDIKGAKPITLDEARGKGVLASAPGSVERFMSALAAARDKRRNIVFEQRSHQWSNSLRNADKKMAKLFRKLSENQEEIHSHLENVLVFLKHDPLYVPYLFNETMNMAGLAKARHSYEPKDLGEFRRIVRDVLRKVREVDRLLAPAGNRAA